MDSDITLVSPSPPTYYFLSSTDLDDAVIYSQPSVPLYRITSDARDIKIWDCSTPDRVIAVLHHRDLLRDTLYFPQRCVDSNPHVRNVSIRRWLKRSKMLDGVRTFTFDTEYGRYVWKLVSRSQTMVFPDYDLEHSVATCNFSRSPRTDVPALVVHSDGEPLRDDIVIAYFVQRHRVSLESKVFDLFVGAN